MQSTSFRTPSTITDYEKYHSGMPFYQKHKMIQVIHKQTEQIHAVILKKGIFQEGKTIKIKIGDVRKEKSVTYLAKIFEISRATGIKPKKILKLEKGEISHVLHTHNQEAFNKKVTFLIQSHDFITSLLEVINRAAYIDFFATYNLLKLISKNTTGERLHFLLNILITSSGNEELSLKNLKTIYALSDEDIQKIRKLTRLVKSEYIEILLNLVESTKVEKLLKTLYKASEEIDSLENKNIYVKKSIDTYSFCFSIYGDLLIGLGLLTQGSVKKINHAVNASTLEGLVKVMVKGNDNVKIIEKEAALHKKFYQSYHPYILKPSLVHLFTNGKWEEIIQAKFIEFASKLEGDGTSIRSEEILKIAQFIYDFAKGLKYLHKNGYVHCDVKPENALIRGKRAYIIDWGVAVQKGSFIRGGTPPYWPGDAHILSIVTSHFDRFALGVTLLKMLFPDLFNEIEKINENRSLGGLKNHEREILFENLKNQTQENKESLSSDHLNIKIAMINLAQEMTDRIPSKRPSCKTVAEKLVQMVPDLMTSDPS